MVITAVFDHNNTAGLKIKIHITIIKLLLEFRANLGIILEKSFKTKILFKSGRRDMHGYI